MQLNDELHAVNPAPEKPPAPRSKKKNKKWPPIFFLELPQVMMPRNGLVSPAQFVTDMAIAKEMMLAAAKARNCMAYWSKERRQWLLVSNEVIQNALPSFCGPYSSVKKLRNRQSDYAAVAKLLSQNDGHGSS